MAENQDNHFGSGLLVGSLIGAGVIFLLGTKKGKKLLKAIAEEGFEGVTELEGILEDKITERYPKAKKIIPKIQKRVTKKINQIKRSEPVQRVQDAIEQVQDSEVYQTVTEKIDEAKESEFVQDKLEPIMGDVAVEAENVATQVQKSAKRLFKGIPRRLRK